MRMRPLGRRLGLLAGAVLTIQWSLTAQTRSSATPSTKRPITYDVMDSWRSIQGQRLSRDGQWLAYALTAQGDDGELVVRSLGGGQEFRAPRGTNPSFTPDGRFVVFTIAQTKADEERERQQNQRNNAQGAGAPAATPTAAPPAAATGETPQSGQAANPREKRKEVKAQGSGLRA